jgi:hypothetical protein
VYDDTREEHPGPVQHKKPSDPEHSSATTLEMIQTLAALGYRIEPPSVADAKDGVDEDVAAILSRLERGPSGTLDLAALLAVWRAHDPQVWRQRPAIYAVLAEHILKVGEPLVAHDVLTEGLEYAPRDVRLRQLQALALSRSGAVGRANKVLGELVAAGHADEETLGLLARTHKDLWARATGETEREHHLSKAY